MLHWFWWCGLRQQLRCMWCWCPTALFTLSGASKVRWTVCHQVVCLMVPVHRHLRHIFCGSNLRLPSGRGSINRFIQQVEFFAIVWEWMEGGMSGTKWYDIGRVCRWKCVRSYRIMCPIFNIWDSWREGRACWWKYVRSHGIVCQIFNICDSWHLGGELLHIAHNRDKRVRKDIWWFVERLSQGLLFDVVQLC